MWAVVGVLLQMRTRNLTLPPAQPRLGEQREKVRGNRTTSNRLGLITCRLSHVLLALTRFMCAHDVDSKVDTPAPKPSQAAPAAPLGASASRASLPAAASSEYGQAPVRATVCDVGCLLC
jgi:hypothetical protein